MKFIAIAFILNAMIISLMVERIGGQKQEWIDQSLRDSKSIIQRILTDPEFLSLNPERQLRVLFIIFNMLERISHEETSF